MIKEDELIKIRNKLFDLYSNENESKRKERLRVANNTINLVLLDHITDKELKHLYE